MSVAAGATATPSTSPSKAAIARTAATKAIAATKPSPTLASSSSSPPPRGQGPQTLQSIEDQWRKRASADHRNYTSVTVEWSSNEAAAVVGARAAAAVADVAVEGGEGGVPTVERVSLSFVPSSSEGSGGVSAKLSVSRVRARLARLEFARGGSGGGGGSAAAAATAAASAAASDAAAAAAAAALPPQRQYSHPVAAILAAIPLGGLRRVRCCEGTVLEALEALLPAEVEVEVAEAEKEKKEREKKRRRRKSLLRSLLRSTTLATLPCGSAPSISRDAASLSSPETSAG